MMTEAIARLNQLHEEDPHRVPGPAGETTEARLYAERMSQRLAAYAPDASEVLRLATHAQHLGRWQIPRSEYPEGRAGYLRWRNRLGKLHAELASKVLNEVGYASDVTLRVARLLQKKGLGIDAEMQILEDVICLVFVEHYLEEFSAKHEEGKVVDIIQKTLKKMSENAHQAALTLPLTERTQALLAKALNSVVSD